jgi:hypothetical protein
MTTPGAGGHSFEDVRNDDRVPWPAAKQPPRVRSSGVPRSGRADVHGSTRDDPRGDVGRRGRTEHVATNGGAHVTQSGVNASFTHRLASVIHDRRCAVSGAGTSRSGRRLERPHAVERLPLRTSSHTALEEILDRICAHTLPREFDVVVIGAGPTGEVAAGRLGRAGPRGGARGDRSRPPDGSRRRASFYGRRASRTLRIVVDAARGVVVGATFTGLTLPSCSTPRLSLLSRRFRSERLRHAAPGFPTRSELWLRLLERYEENRSSIREDQRLTAVA